MADAIQRHPQNIYGAQMQALNLGGTPQPSYRPTANLAKVELSQLDTNTLPQNLHSIPEFANLLKQIIIEDIQGAGIWYTSDQGLPVVVWNRLSFQYQTYHFPVATIEPNPDHGSVPLVDRSTESFEGDVQLYRIGAKFSLAEINNQDAGDQQIDIMTQVTDQLRKCVHETLGRLVMRTLIQVDNYFRKHGHREDYFANWTIETYVNYLKMTHGAASRGEGGFQIMLDLLRDMRQNMHLPNLDRMAIHRTVRALLVQDNREHFIGGDQGVDKFLKGKDAMNSFHGYTLNVADTFRVTEDVAPENVLERLHLNGEFYFGQESGLDDQAYTPEWKGFKIYDEGRDGKCALTREALNHHLCWWDKDGKLDQTVLQTIADEWNASHPAALRTPYGYKNKQQSELDDVAYPPHPGIVINENLDGVPTAIPLSQKATLGDVSDYWLSRESISAGPVATASQVAVGKELHGRLRAAYEANGAARFVRVDSADATAAVSDAPDHFDAVGARGFVFDKSGLKMYGACIALTAARARAKTFFTKGNDGGVYIAAVRSTEEAAELARAHGFLEIPAGVDPSNLRKAEITAAVSVDTESGTIGAAKGASKAKEVRSPIIQFDTDHARELAAAPLAKHIRNTLPLIGQNVRPQNVFQSPNLSATFSREGLKALFDTGNYPFHFMVIRDNVRRRMSSAVAYTAKVGSTLLSDIKSMSAGNVGSMKSQITMEFSAGGVVTDPKKMQILENIGYLGYDGGKNCEFVDYDETDDGDESELSHWARDVAHHRGDIVVHAVPIGAGRQLQYASLTGVFDTKGFPITRVMPHNSGYFPGQQFLYHKLKLDEIENGRSPEVDYISPAQANTLIIQGTAWDMDNERLSSGINTLDGGDFLGAKQVRLGREFTHDRLHVMRDRSAGRL
jgi:hypothetical protein